MTVAIRRSRVRLVAGARSPLAGLRRWPSPAPSAVGRRPAADQRLGLVLRRAGHAAVGGRRPDPGPVGQLPPDRLARRPDRRTAQDLIDFAGTEAEFSVAAGGGGDAVAAATSTSPTSPARWRSCTTSRTRPGDKVDYLHLSPRTIARIFMGDICNWDDPAITRRQQGPRAARPADHGRLPRRPVGHDRPLLRLRGQHTDPGIFGPWAAKNQLPTTCASSSSTAAPSFAPHDPGVQRLGPDRPVHRQRQRAVERSATTSSATPRPTTCRPRGCRTAPGTWVQPVRRRTSRPRSSRPSCAPT